MWKGWWQFAWSDKIWSGKKRPSEFKGISPYRGALIQRSLPGVLTAEHMCGSFSRSQLIRTPCEVMTPQEGSEEPGGWMHTQILEGWEKRAMGRGGESFPTVTDHSAWKEHRKRSAESTFHLHFKQIGGLVGHYHLECPVMGNRERKGAVRCWLIFTKVFVCVLFFFFLANVNHAADWVEQKGHCGLKYGIVPIKSCLLSAWLMMNTIL